MCRSAPYALFGLVLATVIMLLVGCEYLLPFSPSHETTSPCYYFSAQFYRPLPGGQEFTENWCMWGWPGSQDPETYCVAKLLDYLQHDMSPHVAWDFRNVSCYQAPRDQACDCAVPSTVPTMWGGPIGAEIAWQNPPSTQAYVYISLVDNNGQTRTATPAVDTAQIAVAVRTGMPDMQTGSYIVGQKHARFTDMYLGLQPFWLGDVYVPTCYIQNIGAVIAENISGYQYTIYPGNAKFFFYGAGVVRGQGDFTSFCFTNTVSEPVQVFQGPGMTFFSLSLTLPSNVLGQQMQINVSLSKPWSQPSQFSAHQPYVYLADKTLAGPNVVLQADQIGDEDNDLTKVLWFKDFETPFEEFLGAGNPCSATLPAGSHWITCVAYDSRGTYGVGDMTLWVTPPNDTCENAQPVGLGLTWGDNTGATTEIVAPCAEQLRRRVVRLHPASPEGPELCHGLDLR